MWIVCGNKGDRSHEEDFVEVASIEVAQEFHANSGKRYAYVLRVPTAAVKIPFCKEDFAAIHDDDGWHFYPDFPDKPRMEEEENFSFNRRNHE